MVSGRNVATLDGNGVHGALGISPRSLALAFGKDPIGKSAAKMVTLTNKNSVGLVISAIAVTPDSTNFAASQGCVGTIVPNVPCHITVTFAPPTKGRKKATLVITDAAAGGRQVVSLSGIGQ
jgi:hypothetical protein